MIIIGRYFGVACDSWHWKDICGAIHAAYPSYEVPPLAYEAGSEAEVTKFDHI